MARLQRPLSEDPQNRSSVYRDRSHPPGPSNGQTSSSPTPSSSPDKENRGDPRTKRTSMPGSNITSPDDESDARSAKRQRVQANVNGNQQPRRALVQRVQTPHMTQVEMDEQQDLKYYNPDQDPLERRILRKGLRDLGSTIQDFKATYLNPDNDGLHDTIRQQNELFETVRQTNDACMDSRLLTAVSDLTYKKSQKAARGEGYGQGIDADDFVSKCISFMRQGGAPTAAPTSTQRVRRRGGRADEDDDDEDEDIGDALNWQWFGFQACFPVNSRPPTPAFLLGPLSVQKRVRAPRVRKERSQRQGPVETTRPEELKAADLERNEKSNLTSICTNLHMHMKKTTEKAKVRVDEELQTMFNRPPSEEEGFELLAKYNICDDEGLDLIKFALHPTSFGQTVENLFYISFLIKDNHVGLKIDSKGRPSMRKLSLAPDYGNSCSLLTVIRRRKRRRGR